MGISEQTPSTTISASAGPSVEAGGDFAGYPLPEGIYDEVFDSSGRVRPAYRRLVTHLAGMSAEELAGKSDALELSLRAQGITFTVYGGAGSASSEGSSAPSPSTWCPGSWPPPSGSDSRPVSSSGPRR